MSHLPTLEQTSKHLKFSAAVSAHLDSGSAGCESEAGSALLGSVSHDGSIACLAKGSSLELVYLERNERLAAWTFASGQLDSEPEITTLLPFTVERNETRWSHILVGLDCGVSGGLLCVFDISGSKVIRAISVSQQVSSLALVSVAGGPSVPAHFHPALRYFHGIAGVGTVGGRVYLVDLALDEASESSDSQPASLTLLHPPARRDIPGWRREVTGRGSHLALLLNSQYLRDDIFLWEEVSSVRSSQPSHRKEVQFAMEQVEVTALHYSPHVVSLAVGYNIGTWSLISMHSLQVEHSSVYAGALKPVQSITFQEPENDPRNYVYYWILRSYKGPEDEMGEGLAVASLYSLTYAHKQSEIEAEEGTVALYTGLEAVSLRFEHMLSGDPGQEEPLYSWGLTLYTLELPTTNPNRDNSDLEAIKDLGLSVMVWKAAQSRTDQHPATYLGVFDLNAWYQAQMPGCHQPDTEELCSYLSFSSIESAGGKSGGILDVCVIRDSLSRFSGSGQTLEQHCFPSSLKFDLVVLTATGYLRASHLGLQRRVLSELGSRSSCLVQPSELYQLCLLAGLGGPGASCLEPSLLAQRELLLNVLLEHTMVGVIVGAARDWADGRYSKSGCSLRFLLDWAWRRVGIIKERLDHYTVPLFDHSLVEADENCRQLLVQLTGQLAQLCCVFSALTASSRTLTYQGLEELESRQSVTGLVLLYTQAVSWFVNVGLLPEQPPGPHNPFPVELLTESYREKRRKLGSLTRSYGRASLLVDILCEDVGDALIERFQKAGGVGDYPPPSLHALLSIFLTDSPASAKIRLVQYFFLDLAHLLTEDTWTDLVDNLIKFPSAFSLPPSIIKLTQAFWLLDHEDWEESVCMMLDPLLQDDDLSAAHHRAVLTTLLAHNQYALALKYTRIRRPPILKEEDVQLHISVLLANGAIQEAYTFQRSQRGAPAHLVEFYQRAEELSRLDAVLQLSLTRAEEEQFVRFLQESKRPDSQEVLLMYYLQRSRFSEAMRLHESLKSTGGGGRSAAARNAIMERYSNILPGLASLRLNRPLMKGPAGPYTRPEPVAVVVKEKNISLFSRANSIQEQLTTPARPQPASHTPFRAKGRLQESMEGVKRKVVEYPTLCTYPATSPLADTTQNDLVSPPSKRTRLCDVSSLDMSTKSVRRLSRFMTAEALTILSTPVIRRKERPTLTPQQFQLSRTTIATPQSILKVKNLIREATPTPDEDRISSRRLSADLVEPRSRETTPGKSLRFKVPKKMPPADTVLPPPPGEALTTVFNPDMESPCAELATSSDREISFQVPVHMVDSHTFHRMTIRKVSESSKHSAEESFHSLNATETDESGMDVSGGNSPAQESVPSPTHKEKQEKDTEQEEAEEVDEVAVQEEDEDSDEEFYVGRVFERKECDIYVVSEEDSDTDQGGDSERSTNLNLSWAPEGYNPKLRKSLAAAELARGKEELEMILAAAAQEVEPEPISPPPQPSIQHQEVDEKTEEIREEEEAQRRSSVSTVELDETETHIAPSGSFLDSSTCEEEEEEPVLIISDEEEEPAVEMVVADTINALFSPASEESDEEVEDVVAGAAAAEELVEVEKTVQAPSFRAAVVGGSRCSSSLSFSYDTVTTQVEKQSGIETRFQLYEDDIPEDVGEKTDSAHENPTDHPQLHHQAHDGTAGLIAEQEEEEPVSGEQQEAEDWSVSKKIEVPSTDGEQRQEAEGVLGLSLQEVEELESSNDDMRDLLDQVSTTATRASSVAGSTFSETAPAAASVAHPTSPTLPELSLQRPGSMVSTQIEPIEATPDTTSEDHVEEPKDTVAVEEEPMDVGEDDSEAESLSEEEDEHSEGKHQGGLEFSWTVVESAAAPRLSVQQIVQLEFSQPVIEGSQAEDLNESAVTFEFAAPLDVSMVGNDEEEDEKRNVEEAEEERLDLKLSASPEKRVRVEPELLTEKLDSQTCVAEESSGVEARILEEHDPSDHEKNEEECATDAQQLYPATDVTGTEHVLEKEHAAADGASASMEDEDTTPEESVSGFEKTDNGMADSPAVTTLGTTVSHSDAVDPIPGPVVSLEYVSASALRETEANASIEVPTDAGEAPVEVSGSVAGSTADVVPIEDANFVHEGYVASADNQIAVHPPQGEEFSSMERSVPLDAEASKKDTVDSRASSDEHIQPDTAIFQAEVPNTPTISRTRRLNSTVTTTPASARTRRTAKKYPISPRAQSSESVDKEATDGGQQVPVALQGAESLHIAAIATPLHQTASPTKNSVMATTSTRLNATCSRKGQLHEESAPALSYSVEAQPPTTPLRRSTRAQSSTPSTPIRSKTPLREVTEVEIPVASAPENDSSNLLLTPARRRGRASGRSDTPIIKSLGQGGRRYRSNGQPMSPPSQLMTSKMSESAVLSRIDRSRQQQDVDETESVMPVATAASSPSRNLRSRNNSGLTANVMANSAVLNASVKTPGRRGGTRRSKSPAKAPHFDLSAESDPATATTSVGTAASTSVGDMVQPAAVDTRAAGSARKSRNSIKKVETVTTGAIASVGKGQNSSRAILEEEIAHTTPSQELDDCVLPTVLRTPRSSRLRNQTPTRGQSTPLLSPPPEFRGGAAEPEAISARLETPEVLTPSRRSTRLSAALGTNLQLQLAPDGGVIARQPRGATTPRSVGRSARRHTAVRAVDVATALNLAPLIHEAEDEKEKQAVGKQRKVKSVKSSLPTLDEEEKAEERVASKRLRIPSNSSEDQASNENTQSQEGRRRTDNGGLLTRSDTGFQDDLAQESRRGRRYKSITLGYEAGRLFTPERPASKRSKTAADTAAEDEAEQVQQPPKKYVVHKKKTSRRIK